MQMQMQMETKPSVVGVEALFKRPPGFKDRRILRDSLTDISSCFSFPFRFVVSARSKRKMACATDVARQFLPCVQPVEGDHGARSINMTCNGHTAPPSTQYSAEINDGPDKTCNGHTPPPTQYSAENNDENHTTVASKVLIIGATGFIGRFVAEASVKSGRPTYALVRPTTLSSKPKLIQSLKDAGIQIVYGCMQDHNSLVKAIRQVDVVICTVGGDRILDQIKIVDAIKEVGTVKRFLPSEFGHDVDRADPVEPALSFYIEKRNVRRAVEEARIPYTYVCCNSIAGWPYYYHTHPTELPPPKEKFEIYGDGNVKAFFVTGDDIGAYTMKAVDDPRTLDKSIHFRPPKNFLTLNELADIWEKKIHKTLPRVTVSAEDLVNIAKANFMPASIVAALTHDIFINGCQFKFPIQEPDHVEACELYPDIKYTTVDDFFQVYL